ETGGSQAPVQGEMTELGAVCCNDPIRKFYADFRPVISDISYETREHYTVESVEDYEKYRQKCTDSMLEFEKWLLQCKEELGGSLVFISDNNGFDFSFVSHNFWKYLDRNPFGHSSQNLGSLYKGYVRNFRRNFKHLRKTPHLHDGISDALGNVEAFLTFAKDLNLEL